MKNKFVIFDFETTGLSPVMDEVIEIGAVRVVEGQILERFEVLLKATRPIHPDASAQNGLSDDHLARYGQDPAEHWPQFHRFIADDPLLAHNGLGFDYAFLIAGFARHGLVLGKNPLLDSLPIARKYIKTKSSRHSRDALCRELGIAEAQAHRAMGDVLDIHQVFAHILKIDGNLAGHWALCGSFTLGTRNKLPTHLSRVEGALAEGLEVEIEYAGKNKPKSRRWIRPRAVINNFGKMYVYSFCLIDQVEKSFAVDAIVDVFETRKSG